MYLALMDWLSTYPVIFSLICSHYCSRCHIRWICNVAWGTLLRGNKVLVILMSCILAKATKLSLLSLLSDVKLLGPTIPFCCSQFWLWNPPPPSQGQQCFSLPPPSLLRRYLSLHFHHSLWGHTPWPRTLDLRALQASGSIARPTLVTYNHPQGCRKKNGIGQAKRTKFKIYFINYS